ncbi:MAG TPA: type I phosphomannose isomerase catalytic subunit [Thermomicrobiales bacterium]|nr:type I phosphomannose isomerase catalytic subunit [Thermomicrobiales bacterium]
MQWHPIKLTFHVRAYSFGERLIPEMLGKQGVPDGIVAETWEISDYKDTTGTVKNGPFAGKTLHDLVETHPDELVGEGWRGERFPILAKFLDASHMLPVHLHADDETARRKYGEPNGKSEAWHILHCEPGATILAGIKPGTSRDQIIDAFKRQDYDAVMPRYAIEPGDTIYVPGGVIHSFGPDTLIFEVQQTSDLAQSVMPTDLYGNKLDEQTWDANIAETMDELRTDFLPRPNHGLTRWIGTNRYVVECVGPHFALERWNLVQPHREPAHPERCLTLTNLGDPVGIAYAGGVETLNRAESCIIPTALGAFTLVPDGRAVLLACYVPDLQNDIIAPLKEAGHTEDQIAALGEITP